VAAVLRVLLIPFEGSELPDWQLEGFDLKRAPDQAIGIEWLMTQSYDAAVVVVTHHQVGATELCARIEASSGQDMVPLLLAADGRHRATSEPLEALAFDAFIDLSWDAKLVEQCLSLVIARVRSGRGVVAIQHQVLWAVRREVARLKDLSLRDELTGLYNLRYFREVLGREHQRCARHHRSYAVVCFDLDNLRELNNRHGHPVGTRALERIGLTLTSTTRESDYAFRIGGDEFAALLVETTHQAALAYAERICHAFQRCVLTEGGERITLSTSAGVASYPEDGETVDQVLGCADAQLYRAKALGRGRAVSRYVTTAMGGT
jgi:diguanylate cyclase (GGDEF)-like protein